MATTAASREVRRTARQLTFLVLAFGVGAYSLLQSLVVPVMSSIQHDLHTTQNTVTWLLTAYLLSASIFTPILGRVGDMVGKERILLVSLVALGIGCLIAAIAPNIGVMIVARVIQGVGGAIIPITFGIIRDEFPRDQVTSAVGTMSALIAAGSGLGLVLAGPIVDALDYRWLFWIPLIVVALTTVAAFFLVPESPVKTPGRINWLAATLLSSWLVALLLPVSEGSVWGWSSFSVIGLLILAVVLFIAWIVVEVRSDNPVIDMGMMRLPAVWTTNLVALLFGVGMYSIFAFLPEFLQTPRIAGYGFGASVTSAGLLLLPLSVAMFIAGIVGGRVEDRFPAKAQLTAGSVLVIVACALLAFAHDEKWEILVATSIAGVGVGLAFASMTNLIVQNVPMHQTGVASGMNANIRTIGGAIGSALMSNLVTSSLQPNGLPYESGYTHGFEMLVVASVIATAAALIIPTGKRPTATGTPVSITPRPAMGTNGGQ